PVEQHTRGNGPSRQGLPQGIRRVRGPGGRQPSIDRGVGFKRASLAPPGVHAIGSQQRSRSGRSERETPRSGQRRAGWHVAIRERRRARTLHFHVGRVADRRRYALSAGASDVARHGPDAGPQCLFTQTQPFPIGGYMLTKNRTIRIAIQLVAMSVWPAAASAEQLLDFFQLDGSRDVQTLVLVKAAPFGESAKPAPLLSGTYTRWETGST